MTVSINNDYYTSIVGIINVYIILNQTNYVVVSAIIILTSSRFIYIIYLI